MQKDVYHSVASQLSTGLLKRLKNNQKVFGMEKDQQHKSFHILEAT